MKVTTTLKKNGVESATVQHYHKTNQKSLTKLTHVAHSGYLGRYRTHKIIAVELHPCCDDETERNVKIE